MRLGIFLLLVMLVVSSCQKNIDAKSSLDENVYTKTLEQLSPYVIKKPDEISYEARFDSLNKGYYEKYNQLTSGQIKYFHKTDTANFFFYLNRDLTSLYEHYRGLGGYYKVKEDKIAFINLLYHTPRFTKEEMELKGKKLFSEMIESGNVNKFMGDNEYIHTPNADFYYNTKTNRWDYTENSSWKFLDEAKKEAEGKK